MFEGPCPKGPKRINDYRTVSRDRDLIDSRDLHTVQFVSGSSCFFHHVRGELVSRCALTRAKLNFHFEPRTPLESGVQRNRGAEERYTLAIS